MSIVGLDMNVLAGWYNSKIGLSLASSASAATSGASARSAQAGADVTPPWDVRGEVSTLEEIRRSVLARGVFFSDVGDSEFSRIDAPYDHKALFELHQGLKRLASLAEEAKDKSTIDSRRDFLQSRLDLGVSQFNDFFDALDLEGVNLLKGEKLSKFEGDVAISRGLSEYTTGVLHTGEFDAEVARFTGDVQFTVSVKKNGVTTDVQIDLADMGATTRNLDNVTDHINTQLEAAGMLTRFERVKIGEENEFGIVEGNKFGLKIAGILTEQVSFSAPTASSAVYLAGVSGINETAGGSLVKLTDLASGDPTTEFSTRWEADPTSEEVAVPGGEEGETRNKDTANPLEIRASAAAADGGVFVLGETSATTDGQTLKGENDLVLAKYDSTGKRVWTRVLGSAGEAEAASLAVDASGNVVISGAIQGELGDTTGIGGEDSFVAKFSSTGVEQWLQRFGGSGDDAPSSVTVGADGTIYVAGGAATAFGGANHQGGASDGYVRAIDESGTTLYTRRIGAAGDEAVKAVAMADDGGLLVASVEDDVAVLRKYDSADGASAAVWEQTLGDLGSGTIGGIAVDGSNIYLTGGAEDGFSPTAPLTAHSGGLRDAFVVKLTDGASATVDYTTFVGTNGNEIANDIKVADGKVYLAGKTSGSLPGNTRIGDRDAFVAQLEASDGSFDWAKQITGRGGVAEATSLAVDTSGDSVLDQLGLPQGVVAYSDTRVVTDRTSARDGDHFYISVNGGRRKKVTIDADDTMRSLSFKINAALVLNGAASVRRSPEGDRIQIKPGEGQRIELFAGDDGQDLLKGIGLQPGAVVETVSALKDDAKTTDAPSLFALDLPNSFDLSTEDKAKAAYEALSDAMNIVQRAYRDLTTPQAVKDLLNGPRAGKTGGTVPAYLQAQLANYQAGLSRLNSGGGGSTVGLI